MTAVLDAPMALIPTVIPPPVAPPVRIDYTEAVSLLFRAVAERGGQHRAVGRYFNSAGAPDCLIGVVLSYKGITAARIGPGNNCQAVGALAEAGIIDVADDTLILLSIAQVCQDRGVEWGEILAHLDEQMKSIRDTGKFELQVEDLTHTITFHGAPLESLTAAPAVLPW